MTATKTLASHLGWLLGRDVTNVERFAPDLLADRDSRMVDRLCPFWVTLTFLLPAWSVNSVWHTMGQRPFAGRDKAANHRPPAILSFGESWHNLHHADPSARHGVLRGQIDISARLIWIFEKIGWASSLRWPTPARLNRITANPQTSS
jgi:stearoyl-CoA desaturase (delta-9 desaturase)